MFPFATAGSGESDFRTRRLALASTVVAAVAALLPETGSSADVTVAVVLRTVPFAIPAPTFTTSVKDTLAPADSAALVQLTVPVAPTAGVVQLHPAGELRDTKVVPAGRESARATVVALAAVRLVTPIV